MDAGALIYPKHRFNPEDLLTFVELKSFTSTWEQLGLNSDDLLALQIGIMCDPSGPPIVVGTGGLRKTRFAPPKWNTGKSGALRVCYVFFDEYKKVLLSIVYPKSERENLTQAQKARIKTLIESVEKEFERRSPK